MKKVLSLLLAFTMVQTPILAYESPLVANQESKIETVKQSSALSLDIDFTLPLAKSNQDYAIATLSNETEVIKLPIRFEDSSVVAQMGGNEVSAIAHSNQEEADAFLLHSSAIEFKNLPQGMYTVKLEGNGFRTLEQKVDVTGYNKHLGVDNLSIFTIGDVNHDAQVNDLDYDAILDHIDTKNVDEIKTYDLNRDGLVDVLDLGIAHRTLGNKAMAAIDSLGNAVVDTSKVELVKNQNPDLLLKGSAEDLFSEASQGVVSFGFADEKKTISAENMVNIEVALTEPITMNKVSIDAGVGEHAVQSGIAEITTETGEVITANFEAKSAKQRSVASSEIVINLGKQVAVKKITIRVSGTRTNKNLAEIATVSFLNDVYQEIPKPDVAYPSNIRATSGNESFTITWDKVINVSGYEVKYTFMDPETNTFKEVTNPVSKNTYTVEGLENFVDYSVYVQSISDDGWKSGYAQAVIVTPMPTAVPKLPTNTLATGGYRFIDVSWGKAENAITHNLYYRIKGEADYQKITDIKNESYKLENLKDDATYEIYITGSNAIGEGGRSPQVEAKTTSLKPVITPKYNLINTSNGMNQVTTGIKDVTYPSLNVKDYPYTYDKFDIVDDDETSYWNINSWDAGGYNVGKPSPIVEFDEVHTFGEFVVTPSYNAIGGLAYVKVIYWDENGVKKEAPGVSLRSVKDSNNATYYRVQFDKPIVAKKIQINLAQYWAGNKNIKFSELKFYEYDSIKNDITALFKDSLQIELSDGVNQAKIDELSARLETKKSGELHPDYANLRKDLDYAKMILDDVDLSKEIYLVDQTLSTKNDANLGFSYPQSDLQPLGIAAREGDEINVYVGRSTGAKGNVELVATQPFAAGSFMKVYALKTGKNVITMDSITSKAIEHGGSLYLRYTGTKPDYDISKNPIKVRVSGGVQVPYLNVSGMRDEAQMKEVIKTYINDLTTYVNTTLPSLYKDDTTFDNRTRALNVTDVMSDQMLLSLPADQILKGIKQGNATLTEQVDAVYQNELALEQLMDLTYAQKGLSRDASDPLDRLSSTRINIRYMDVQNAFMYAGGNHVGIPYDVSSALMQGVSYDCPKTGDTMCSSKEGGSSLYGWGIAHEIGHVTDQKKGVYGETSNNVVSLFAETIDEVTRSRVGKYEDDYSDIYKKVTSGTTGLSANVLTQLGMFWQLHLAYDDAYVNPKDTTVFNARMYQEYRRVNANGIDKDNLLVRVASKAAGKDLSDYFEHWGLIVSEETKAALSTLPKEDKPIYYLNETARKKRIDKTATMSKNTVLSVTLSHDSENGNDSKQAQLQMSVSGDVDKILGYEIYRNGKVIAFTNDAEYLDTIVTANNRVYTYEVIAYDYALNPTNKVSLDPIKIKHDGSIHKNNWDITSNVLADQDKEGVEKPEINTLPNVIDHDVTSVYEGKVDKGNVIFTLDMNTTQPLVGLKYTGVVGNKNNVKKYEVQIRSDKTNWKSVAKGSFKLDAQNASETIFFSDSLNQEEKSLEIFDAQYVRVIMEQKEVCIAELDLLAPPGDNVELLENGIGILKDDYTYAKDSVIKKGSLIFTGEYRGNPAFNEMLILDEEGRVVAGHDENGEGEVHEILLANIPEGKPLNEIASGTWIYWIEPEQLDISKLPKKIRAELYRVDNAETSEGQRMVSDTLFVNMPEELPEITLTSDLNGR